VLDVVRAGGLIADKCTPSAGAEGASGAARCESSRAANASKKIALDDLANMLGVVPR
jgi:hypothetical protein